MIPNHLLHHLLCDFLMILHVDVDLIERFVCYSDQHQLLLLLHVVFPSSSLALLRSNNYHLLLLHHVLLLLHRVYFVVPPLLLVLDVSILLHTRDLPP